MDLQSLILNLQRYWADCGCIIQQPYDLEVGAGTMHPESFLRVLGPEPYRVAYVQPSRRPADARYGENPFRLGRHLQLQVILKPSPDEVQELYLESLGAIGIDRAVHDIRFEEDNWESPTLGAWGVGWQVLLDGMEITQFTYFQQAGGIELAPITAELTYGLERIAMFLQRKDSIYDIEWGGGVSYGQVRLEDERESSVYGFEVADVEMLRRHFEDWEGEAQRCLEHDPPLVIPAVEATLKTSHLFNLMDARGAISVTERVGLITRVRRNAVAAAKASLEQRERLGFPLGGGPENHDGGGRLMATFLLEIRTEEIPAAALPGARAQLNELFAARLGDAGFADAKVVVYSTSRRLAVQVEGLPDRQPDRTEEMTGPPVRVAVAEDGTPTPAGEGFARKVGLPFAEVGRIETDKGEYLAATVVHEGRATAEVLAELVPSVVAALRFPKMMRWGDGSHQFVRPVHGVVALLGTEIVAIELFGIASGRVTVGHRVHAPAEIELVQASDYVAALAERGVVVDPAVRRRDIEALADSLAEAAGARIHPDPELVSEHVELVEWPGLLAGSFKEGFLELPPEVVVTTLRYHQKCLVLEDNKGVLQPGFLAVADRKDDPEGLIRQGNEWVIGARLADAGFFFAEDRKRTMAEYGSGLGRLEFHRVLGSLGDKAARVAGLAVTIADLVQSDVDRDVLRAAAPLAKTDLLTNMVGEFPELQGIMGGHYLRLEGASRDLWTAVRDHYLPVGFDGAVPESEIGKLLGVADRLDTVAGLFAVGERPTGSKDPFGLRRAAQGAVKIVVESGWDLDFEVAIAAAVAAVEEFSSGDDGDLETAVTDFLGDRVRRWLIDVVGVSGDTADAVMAVGWSNLPNTVARAEALQRVREADSFRSLALAFKRVRNITEDQPDAAVDPALFAQPEEGELYEATAVFRSVLEKLLPEKKVDEAFKAMEPLADVLERFFVEVLVMSEDAKQRANRVALLKELGRDFYQLADLSKLQVEGGEK